ncbi:hypothetical protein L6164_002234 [Bauhinia variegata]|uniref:Uncharacterized protein n=1 Tax=Bauhinia variegata TaxID=167791 RepID=A0ACB9PXJ9_BAUVA|nr:hypothetical protein L6164_002234 [Bauhinia variegata]
MAMLADFVVDFLLGNEAVSRGKIEVNLTNENGLTPLDVLLLCQNDSGDILIERAFLGAGAMTSRGISTSLEASQITSRNEEFLKQRKDRDQPNDAHAALLTIATLILSATYQAVLSPPSGLWQDDGLGKSILASQSPALFIYFMLGNRIGFYICCYVIYLKMDGIPIRNLLRFSTVALTATYVAAMSEIIPGRKTALTFTVLTIVLPIVIYLYI